MQATGCAATEIKRPQGLKPEHERGYRDIQSNAPKSLIETHSLSQLRSSSPGQEKRAKHRPISLRTCVYSRYAKLKSLAMPEDLPDIGGHGLDLDKRGKVC